MPMTLHKNTQSPIRCIIWRLYTFPLSDVCTIRSQPAASV